MFAEHPANFGMIHAKDFRFHFVKRTLRFHRAFDRFLKVIGVHAVKRDFANVVQQARAEVAAVGFERKPFRNAFRSHRCREAVPPKLVAIIR